MGVQPSAQVRSVTGRPTQTGDGSPWIQWEAVINNRMTVLLDFRHELDLERRRFMMLWAFTSFFEFIKHRGAGRHQPMGLVVDEITTLYNFDAQSGSDIFAAGLDELINI